MPAPLPESAVKRGFLELKAVPRETHYVLVYLISVAVPDDKQGKYYCVRVTSYKVGCN